MGTKAWGYDAVNKVWRPVLVTAAGAIKVKALQEGICQVS